MNKAEVHPTCLAYADIPRKKAEILSLLPPLVSTLGPTFLTGRPPLLLCVRVGGVDWACVQISAL